LNSRCIHNLDLVLDDVVRDGRNGSKNASNDVLLPSSDSEHDPGGYADLGF